MRVYRCLSDGTKKNYSKCKYVVLWMSDRIWESLADTGLCIVLSLLSGQWCNKLFGSVCWHTGIDLTFMALTHLPPVLHICVSNWVSIGSDVPSHYLKRCWFIVKWTLGNKPQWNFNHNTKLFIQENASENIVCEMAAILSRGRGVKTGLLLFTSWC